MRDYILKGRYVKPPTRKELSHNVLLYSNQTHRGDKAIGSLFLYTRWGTQDQER